jgi:hypothetical protein
MSSSFPTAATLAAALVLAAPAGAQGSQPGSLGDSAASRSSAALLQEKTRSASFVFGQPRTI